MKGDFGDSGTCTPC